MSWFVATYKSVIPKPTNKWQAKLRIHPTRTRCCHIPHKQPTQWASVWEYVYYVFFQI